MRQQAFIHVITVLVGLFDHPAFGQSGLSLFGNTGRASATTFVMDYQAIGINPANLGWEWRFKDKHLALGLAEGSYGVYSDALSRDDIRQRMFNSDFRFTDEERDQAVANFTDAGATINVDVMALGACWSNERIGGFAFQARDRLQVSARMGSRMADLVFKGSSADVFDLLVLATGDTVSNYAGMSPDSLALVVLGIATEPQILGQVLDGTEAGFLWYREFNFSYGRWLVRNDDLEIDAGIGLKYLLGIGVIDMRAEGGGLSGFSSLSPDFQIDYQTGSFLPGARFSFGDLAFPRSVGKGFGVDLGLAARINGTWKLGLSVTDLGSIRWSGDAYEASNGSLVEMAATGLENYDLINGLDDFLINGGLLEWEEAAERSLPLASTARIGLGKLVGDRVELGTDLLLPLNQAVGSLESPAWGLGADLRPFHWLQFSTGMMAGGGQSVKVPLGLTFIVGNGTYEAGFASRDILTYFTKSNPTVSLSMGFLRFRF
jgi:hypothetical protein